MVRLEWSSRYFLPSFFSGVLVVIQKVSILVHDMYYIRRWSWGRFVWALFLYKRGIMRVISVPWTFMLELRYPLSNNDRERLAKVVVECAVFNKVLIWLLVLEVAEWPEPTDNRLPSRSHRL